MSTDISTAAKRAKLGQQHEPHWHKLSKGVYLGFRVGEDSNTWRARVRDRDGTQHFDSLDVTAGHITLADGDEFTAAKKLCESFAATIVGGGGGLLIATIGEAINTGYFGHLTKTGRDEDSKRKIRTKLGVCLIGTKNRKPQPLASVLLAKADRVHFRQWYDWLAALPIKNQTKNNYLKHVKAALNRLSKEGYACNPLAWLSMERFTADLHEPAAYLSELQRSAYARALSQGRWGEAAFNFARGMYECGARPIDAARAKVSDFNPDGTVTLYTRKGKSRAWRPYIHPISASAIEWLKKLTKNKLPSAYLFPTPEGRQWNAKKWQKVFRAARADVNKLRKKDDPCYLPATTRVNSWRHAKITDMLYAGISSTVVAKQCGTSTAMIDKTYFHVIAILARKAVADLRFAA